MAETPGQAFDALAALIARLRGPGGCPWDREQTHESLKSTTLEEAYEVVEAVDQGDAELVGELGDLLLQVVFHAQIAAEGGRFTLAEVVRKVSDKMVRRHPHVFGNASAESSAEVLRNWEEMKIAERVDRGERLPSRSMLDSVSSALPAVMEAFQITTKASRVGFDWPDVASVENKVREELQELHAEIGGDPGGVTNEIGDVLFAVVNLSRALGVDPESALKASNRKFRRRFARVEEGLREKGRTPAESSLQEMDGLWDEAKKAGL
jgi:tetrapyrrole methylase family protein/MazG family protein